jgi:hypothetical protein
MYELNKPLLIPGLREYEIYTPPEATPSQTVTQQVGQDVKQITAGIVSNPSSLILPLLAAAGLYWAFLSKKKPVAKALGFAKKNPK